MIQGVITGGVLFVSVVTILSAVGVVGNRDVPVQTAAPAQMDADEKLPLPSPDSGHAPGEAGLYDPDGKMTRTWEELQKEGIITVQDNSIKHADVMAQLSGQLVIGEGITSIGENALNDIPVVYYNGTASGRPWEAKAVEKYG